MSETTDRIAAARLRSIFDAALDLAPEHRSAFLASACGGDEDLRRRIESMVATAEGQERFLSAPSAAVAEGRTVDPPSAADRSTAPAAAVSEGPGSRIGPYKLLQQIGEGGFGVVFMAEQEHPVRRRVALKVIKLGMDTRQVVARFEQERQALAMMDHPNIAKVLDAGSTVAGRPYFVMELVRGVPITEYCDQAMLTPRERIELFVPVCLAVEHAHQKGIIHRDLKPSNILVTLHDGVPVPKVIDFGIAKATNARLTERTLFTEHRQLIGTPAYMSPEQAEMSGLDIDTRSDIYSLGVLLYELLTGTTPFDTTVLLQAGFGEIQRMIREVDPPKPSTRVSTLGKIAPGVAAHRRTEPAKLGALIRGDLDWIVMKAMDKDRARRYSTASGFATDLRRHLGGDPVEAAPPSSLYAARKFVRRRRGLVAAVGAVAAVAGLGVLGMGFGWMRERNLAASEREARAGEATQRLRAEASTAFLKGMFESIDPERNRGRDVLVVDLIADASNRLGPELVRDPEVEASLRQMLGEAYNQLGRYREAKEEWVRAIEIRSRTLGPEHRDTLAARFGLGAALVQLDEIEPAVRSLKETFEAQAHALGATDPDTLATRGLLGHAMQRAGDAEAALVIYRETAAAQAKVLGASDKATLETMSSIADVLQDLGRLEEARVAAEELVTAASAAMGPDAALSLAAKSILASILNDLGRHAEAEAIARAVFEAKRRMYGLDHYSTLITVNVLAGTLEQLDRFDEAIALQREAIDAAARVLGSEHDMTVTLESNLARNEQLRGNLDEAERLMRKVLEIRQRLSGPDSIATLTVLNNLGLLLLARERPAEAEPVLRSMQSGVERTMPEGHWIRGQAKVNLARSLAGQGKYTEAEPLMLAGYAELTKALPEGHSRRTIASESIAELYASWGKPEESAAWKARR
jgi:serine/threonine protein kinase/tetratricopeptide (TPR) repeat protein